MDFDKKNTKQPKSCLIIAPNWIGDLLMSYPLIVQLKLSFPNMAIDVLAPQSNADILQFMPEIRSSLVNHLQHKKLPLKKMLSTIKEIKTKHYDWSLILPNSLKSSIIPYLAQIPKRTGYLSEARFLTLNDVYRKNHSLPLYKQYLSLVFKELEPPFPRLKINENERKRIAACYKISPYIKYIAFCPGAAYGPAKQWPPDYFSQLGSQLIRMGYHIILFGSFGDQPICHQIQKNVTKNITNLCGKTSLKDTTILLSFTEKIVSNDSGLMHIGAALDKELYCLFGSSSPSKTPPLSQKKHIFYLHLQCSPCFKRQCPLKHHNCMRQILPQQVYEKIRESS